MPSLSYITIYPPYICPHCNYIWDSKANFHKHEKYCIWDKELLQYFAEKLKADVYNSQKVPQNRCSVVLESGARKGLICYRNAQSQTPGHCVYHPPDDFTLDQLNELLSKISDN